MSRSLIFHTAAKAEFLEASKWYDRRRAGLAKAFITEVDRAVSRGAENPFQFVVVYEDIRRVMNNRFP